MRKNQRWATASYGAYPYAPSVVSSTTARAGQAGRNAGGLAAGQHGMDLVKGKHASSPGGLMSGFMALKMELRQIQGRRDTDNSASQRLKAYIS